MSSKSVILGVAAFHPDSAACLVVDGELKAAVSEERLGRRLKHDAAFPEKEIDWVLKSQGLTYADVTHVAVARDTSANRAQKITYVLTRLTHALDCFLWTDMDALCLGQYLLVK